MMELDWHSVSGYIDASSIAMLVLGVALGIIAGAIPGVTGSLGLSLAIPFTMFMSPLMALGLMAGIYKGSLYGGAIAAVSFGIPGTPEAAPTTFDGYPMARQGNAKAALRVALNSSVTGDFISVFVLIGGFSAVSAIALKMGPREMFALLLVALAVLAALSEGSVSKSFIGVSIGVLASLVGPDPMTGVSRLTFSVPELRAGIGLVPFMIGVFALSEMMHQWQLVNTRRLSPESSGDDQIVPSGDKSDGPSSSDGRSSGISMSTWYKMCWRETLLGSGIGAFLGTLPGAGATLSSFTSYGLSSRMRKNRGRFGSGAPEGVAASESANSATAGAALVPLFALGIPGSAMAAILAGALMLQGITPGPGMVQEYGSLVYAFFFLLLFGSVTLYLLGSVVIPFYSFIASLSMRFLLPPLLVVCVIGVYTIQSSPFAVYVAVGAGLLGLGIRLCAIPLGGLLLAYIIGPMLEANLRRGAILSGGDWQYWFASPIAIVLYVAAIVMVYYFGFRRSRVVTESADAGRSSSATKP